MGAPATGRLFFPFLIVSFTRWCKTWSPNSIPLKSDFNTVPPNYSIANNITPNPSDFEILNYFPDPVKDNATVNFLIGRAMYVRLELYSLLGQYVTTVYDGHREAGVQSAAFNTAGTPTGTYYLRMSSDNTSTVRQLRIVK